MALGGRRDPYHLRKLRQATDALEVTMTVTAMQRTALIRGDVAYDAQLAADRRELIVRLLRKGTIAQGCAVAEVGVAYGTFSKYLLEQIGPHKFFAIDTFIVHTLTECMGAPVGDRFGSRTHRDYYQEQIPQATVLQGLSHEMLETIEDKSLGLIYLDAGHLLEDVRRDLAVSVRKLTDNGVIIGNDYTMFDVRPDGSAGGPYGVLQAFNELIATDEFIVVGFGLDGRGYHDIAIARRRS